MTAPIKTCDYCGATGEMPTFMNGETICYTCLHVLPKTLPEARQELMRLRALLAIVAQPALSVPEGWKLVPIEPTPGMIDAAEYVDWGDADVRGSCINAWNRMLSVAPEAKP